MTKRMTTLFCDLGGVLLTNGWGHQSRTKAAEVFGFDAKDFESRHQLVFGDYEVGKISLNDYLHYVLFYQERSFSRQAFIEFMFEQSQPLTEMLDFVRQLKKDYQLKLVIVSNEGRELTEMRVQKFFLKELADIFIVSCFVGVKKPDHTIYRIALDTAQAHPNQTIYLEDRELFVEIAQEFGIHSIQHQNLSSTQQQVLSLL